MASALTVHLSNTFFMALDAFIQVSATKFLCVL